VTEDHAQSLPAAGDPVIDRYSGLARTALAGGDISGCDPGGSDGSCFGAAAYPDQAGVPEAALRASLGCGNPLAVASLSLGETVLDLGSGGGLDVLLSARRVGPDGIAYGLDASPDMLTLARAAADQAGVANARFLQGRIEDIPLPEAHVDVVISNCVINLSADKPRVLAEAFRVLRPGGRLGVSDVISEEHLDPVRLGEAEQRVGCARGTLTRQEYRGLLLAAGFTAISITSTHQADAGLHSAIIQAVRPAAPDGVLIRPMQPADADSGELLGWAAAKAVSGRRVYARVIEHSVYVRPGCYRRGIGAALLQALTGFRTVGTRERIACHHGRWRDTLLLERRSGTDAAG
jgi:SAM-dependent methyltransferase